jgi:hypothetical protein
MWENDSCRKVIYVDDVQGPEKVNDTDVKKKCMQEQWIEVSLHSCSRNGTPHTSLLIVKFPIKSLSWIITAPLLTVLSSGTLTQIEPSFIMKNISFG